jgi:hypothetical protein
VFHIGSLHDPVAAPADTRLDHDQQLLQGTTGSIHCGSGSSTSSALLMNLAMLQQAGSSTFLDYCNPCWINWVLGHLVSINLKN